MRKMILAALLLLPQAPALVPNVDQASSILSNVAAAYRTARSCYIEGNVTAGMTSDGVEARIQSSFVWATVPPTMIRMQAKSPMMEIWVVSDGATAWQYIRHLKQYMTKRTGPTTITSRGIDSVDYTSDKAEYARMMALAVGVAIPRFEDIADSLKEARLLPDETLKIDNASIDCYVIEAVYQSAGAQSPPTRKTFWVDKNRYVVLRQVLAAGLGKAQLNAVEQPRIITTFSAVKIDEPLPAGLFVFIPPSGTKEVKDLANSDSTDKRR